MKLNELLFYWSQNQQHIENMNCNKSATRWLFTLTCFSGSTFVNELFELFEDDTKFAAHLKLFQNPDPRKSQRLVQLNVVRKQLVNDIAANISGKTMSNAMNILLNQILRNISLKDVIKLESLIQNWTDIKTTNESITSLKFHNDRSLLQRLKLFRFKNKQLLIELMPSFAGNNENNEKDIIYNTPTLLHPPVNSFNKVSPVSSFIAEIPLPKSPQITSSENTGLLSPKIDDEPHLQLEEKESESKFQFNNLYQQPEDTLTSDDFISLHDRLLIYTSAGQENSIPPHLINKPLSNWSNSDIVEFFYQELKGSRTVIDDEYHDGIITILKKIKISGSKFQDTHITSEEFRDIIFNDNTNEETFKLFADDESKKDMVAAELQKVIQLQIMRTQVADIIPKFEIAKKIQKLRVTYYETGGRDCLVKHETLDIFHQDLIYYRRILSKWRFYHYKWKLMIADLRTTFPLLSYLTVMDMRFICKHVELYKYYHNKTQKNISLAQSHIQKLTAKFAFICRKIQKK
eukprot:251705_1